MQDPKNGAWSTEKRDGKVVKEEVLRNMAEGTTNMGDIDAARFTHSASIEQR